MKVGLDDYLAGGGSLDDLIVTAIPADGRESQFATALDRLARMTVIEYEQARSAVAGELGIRRSKLDELVAQKRISHRKSTATSARSTIAIEDAGLDTLTVQAWEALRKANNPPLLFQFGDLAVRMINDGTKPVLQDLSESRIRHELAAAADWVRQFKPIFPPRDVATNCLAASNYPLPILRRIVHTPVFTASGALLMSPGYDPASGLYLAEKFDLPAIPEKPDAETLHNAKDVLADILITFPFLEAEPSDRAHAYAAMIQPFVREMIDGPTPLFKFESPTRGTGKGLLSQITLTPALGGNWESLTQAKSDEEWEKRLTSILREAPDAVILDNVTYLVRSASLASALTKKIWAARELGHSRIIRIPIHCAWHLTANNPTLDTDMARRCVRIRIDRGVEHPELLDISTLKHPDIRAYALERRPMLVWAILVLVASWIAAGKPALETLKN